jgi:hypothetical protein
MVFLQGITLTHGQRIYLKNVYSTGNYQLRDKESTRGMGFNQESPVHTYSRNAPQEAYSAGNYQLIYTDSGW